MATRLDALCTLAQVELVLGVDAALVSVREAAIDAATGAILSWLGRRVVHNPALATVTTELQDGGDRYEAIFTNEYPISSVTSLHDDPDRVYGAATLLTEGVHYVVYSEEGRIQLVQGPGYSILTGRSSQYFSSGYQNIQVVYVAGYTDNSALPDDLVQACVEWAVFILNTQKYRGFSESSISLCRRVFTGMAKGGPPPHIRTLLAAHRSPMIARV